MGKPKSNPNCLPVVVDPDKRIAIDIKDSREEKFVDLLFVCKSIREAALAAGYSETYSGTPIYQKFKSPSFQAKIINAFKTNCYTDLPLVQKINHASLNAMHRDLEAGNLDSVAKLKHIPRQILEITRLLQPEGVQGHTMVNIENLQMLVNGKFNGKADPTDGSTE